ncbi:MAG TPA: acyl carrier protein [Hyphomicrobiales bacterium]|nr:acyl carrier protein [Hyphomicrobiales bacterium]
MDDTRQAAARQGLGQLWQTLLDLPPTQPLSDDSHFLELGGGSMLLLSLQVAIAREFAVELAVDALLARPTLGQMSALLLQALAQAARESAVSEHRP